MPNNTIFLTSPAERWDNGYPVGNGTLGAMFMGDPNRETVYLNEETVWSNAGNTPPDAENFKKSIAELRKLYFENRISELDEKAEALLGDSFQCIASYETAGKLLFDFSKKAIPENYRRELRLDDGVFQASYEKEGERAEEQAFASYAYNLVAIQWEFAVPTDLSLSYERENITDRKTDENGFRVTAVTAKGNLHFTVGIKVQTDGKASANGDALAITGAEELIVFVTVATEFRYPDNYREMVDFILEEADDYDEIFDNHTAAFSELMGRSALTLAGDPALEDLPTDKRLKRLKDDPAAEDPALTALYFTFGKYLLVSACREGTLPANLQGVWAENLENPWNADYHTNINLQMNYWPAEVCDLGECHGTLFDYLNDFLLESGKKTARDLYGCRGTVVHHLSDIFGFTAPADGLWGLWQQGAGWLATHMWEHYLFTLDKDFLRETAYDYMKAAALFYIDSLFEGPGGTLCSGPSTSPENRYLLDTPEGKKEMFLCFSPTMDIEIITEVLQNYIAAEELLCLDPAAKAEAKATLRRLPPLKIGKNGTLNEWDRDYEEAEPGHRHISHAFGLYPGHTITDDTPELKAALRKTLDRRLSFGGGHTGWSRAWLINLFARFSDAEETFRHIRLLLTNSTLPNLFDTHPPFQIDGNFGGTAGIAEAFIQSEVGRITLLPAAPQTLSGSFKGLKARGNVKVDAEFINGKVTAFALSSPVAQTVKVRFPGGERTLILEEDKRAEVKL